MENKRYSMKESILGFFAGRSPDDKEPTVLSISLHYIASAGLGNMYAYFDY